MSINQSIRVVIEVKFFKITLDNRPLKIQYLTSSNSKKLKWPLKWPLKMIHPFKSKCNYCIIVNMKKLFYLKNFIIFTQSYIFVQKITYLNILMQNNTLYDEGFRLDLRINQECQVQRNVFTGFRKDYKV